MRAISLALVFACVRPAGTGPSADASAALVPAGVTLYGTLRLRTLAQSVLLQDPYLAGYRDQALARFGLSATDALQAAARAAVFALPGGASGAFVPGLPVSGAAIRKYRGVPLVSRGGRVAASVAGGALLGDPVAVEAALDVLLGGAPSLRGMPLDRLVRSAEDRTLGIATLEPARLLSLLPTPPPPALLARVRHLAVFATLEGTRVYASVVAQGRDATAGRDLAAWARGQREAFRAQVLSWREGAGMFGSALDPVLAALDAVHVEEAGATARVSVEADLGPISGIFDVMRQLQLF